MRPSLFIFDREMTTSYRCVTDAVVGVGVYAVCDVCCACVCVFLYQGVSVSTFPLYFTGGPSLRQKREAFNKEREDIIKDTEALFRLRKKQASAAKAQVCMRVCLLCTRSVGLLLSFWNRPSLWVPSLSVCMCCCCCCVGWQSDTSLVTQTQTKSPVKVTS